MKRDIEKIFEEIIRLIAEEGMSLTDAIKGKISRQGFYDLLKDKDKFDIYTRAREDRADLMFDEMTRIADDKAKDVNRDRLRIDTRKWILSKMNPKKYGEKLDIDHSGSVTLNFSERHEKLL